MIRWTGLAPWEFEFPIPGSLASTFLALRPPSGRLGDRDLQKGAAREFVIDNLLVRNHFIIVMIRWTGLAPCEFEFPFPGSLTSTFLA